MEFTKTQVIEQDVDRVWQVLAHEFDRVSEWNSEVSASTAAPSVPAPIGAPHGGRVCQVGVGEITERFTSYSESGRRYSFDVAGLPSMVARMSNTTTVTPLDARRCEVTLTLSLAFAGAGRLAGPFVGLQMRRIVARSLDDLKTYLETGDVSARKQKQLAKASA